MGLLDITSVESLNGTPESLSLETTPGTVSPATTIDDVTYSSIPVFIPNNTINTIVDTIMDLPDITDQTESCYELPGYDTFKPKYFSCPVLKPQFNQSTIGKVIYLKNTARLQRLDAMLDEPRTLSRLTVQICHKQEPQLTLFANTYVWNGNSLVGEFEYS